MILPPEWHPQDWLWVGFPHDAGEWPGVLERAQEQIAAFANAVADSGQAVRLIVRDAANEARARALVSESVTLERRVYGDVWLRDTGPLVLDDRRTALRFGFNGWGGKYLMPGDETIGAELARDAGLEVTTADWILEGGAIDGDGTGLVVTTEQCLLNPNRNPHLSRGEIEARLARDLGLCRVLWLGDGLINDHTDGHIDNLARFVGPGRLALPVATGPDDPNAAIYADAAARARGFGVEVVAAPSPGRVEWDGVIQPASYMNFVITTNLVVVPVFGSAHDEAGVAAIAALFPGRETVGLMA
ncbi:MAG: agmatine deiminase family protein, partial [Novosphingobium sp.]|nr:agmatine deiminase family protein [Novosphingobium sp.]